MHTPLADHKSPGEIELERIEAQLRTVQLSLEILASVCASLNDPEPGVGEETHEGEDGFEHEHDNGKLTHA